MKFLKRLLRREPTTIRLQNLEINGELVVEATLTIRSTSDPHYVTRLADHLEKRRGEVTKIDFKNAGFDEDAPRYFAFKLNPESIVTLA